MTSAATIDIDFDLDREPEPVLVTPPVGARARAAVLSRGDRVGAWRVDGELGRGGMGAVYAVTHSDFGKRAALKLCHASILDARFTPDTFLREARTVHLVDHPGVCDVFATGTHDGRPYLAMERLTGRTLGAHLERRPISRVDALAILVELCDVLGAAHAAGVVHRDLKLDNVFVLDEAGPGERRTKLLDWGVARILDEPDPMRGMIAGTLTYVAPEQLLGDDVGPAADVYSLAVLTYQVLFGAPPFAASSDLVLLRKHLHDAPPPPSSLCPRIPPELDALLVAMLAKDPAERPPITEVRRILSRLLDECRDRSRTWLARLVAPVVGHRGGYLVGVTIGLAALIASIALLVNA